MASYDTVRKVSVLSEVPRSTSRITIQQTILKNGRNPHISYYSMGGYYKFIDEQSMIVYRQQLTPDASLSVSESNIRVHSGNSSAVAFNLAIKDD